MRYQKIHSQIWHDEKFMHLSPEAQRLFLYLLSSPHSNSIGLYVINKMYICADLKVTTQQLSKPFNDLISNSLIMYDEAVNLLLIINHLKHNKIENELQAKGASKIVATLPKSKLYQEVIILLPKHYHKPLVKVLRELYAIPEEKEEEEKEEEEKEEIEPLERFNLFYTAYPKKKSKGQAETTWKKLNPSTELFTAIMEGLERSKKSPDWTKENWQFIPHASTWLNAKGWEDEPVKKEHAFAKKDYHEGVNDDGTF